jgi:hypothetical protein
MEASDDNRESIISAMRCQISRTPMPEAAPGTVRQQLHKQWVWAAGAITGVAAILAVAITLLAGSTTTARAAFVVTTHGRAVTIRLKDLAALGELNMRLSSDDIPIRVVPIQAGCRATARSPGSSSSVVLHAGDASARFGSMTISLVHRPTAGQTLVVGISSNGRSSMFPHLIVGPVPRCVAPSASGVR